MTLFERINPFSSQGQRVQTPTVLQMEAVECGAAALAIILEYYGRIVPLEILRQQCGVSRDGSKASSIVKVARTYGFKATGLRTEPNRLRDKPVPFIVFWNFNHFLVVEGFGDGIVYLNDPASGPRTVTEEEFDFGFTGVVLQFEPTEDFTKGGEKPTLRSAMLERLRGSELGTLFVLLVSLALVIPGIFAPIMVQVFVDDLLVNGVASIEYIVAIMLSLAVLTGVLTWLKQTYLLRMETKLAVRDSAAFFWHVLRLPITFFTQRFAGDIVSRVQINDRVATVLSRDVATNLLGIITVIFYAILMLQYDVLLAVIAIIIALLNFAALDYFSRRRKDLNQRLLQDRGKLTGTASNGLRMIETLKSTGSESDFFAEWSGYFAKSINAEQQLSWTSKLLVMIPTLLLAVNTTAILVIGSSRVIEGSMTLGMLLAFQAVSVAFLAPINNFVNLGATLQEVEGDIKRVDDVLKHEVEVEPPQLDNVPYNKLSGFIEIRNLTFGYSPLEKPLLTDFSLSLKPGQRVALVGSSGSGKSTLAKLIAGLYTPWSGDILFDSKVADHIPRIVFSNSVAMVNQDIMLLEGTIRENLSLWDATIPQSQIIKAAQDAAIDDMIAKCGGYNSLVAENGRNFSGGQRQRLEIARALAVEPTLLILDEATSALDPITESRISDSIRRRGCTTIIVAHRLSTVRDADEIIVLERGQIVQRGTHEELYAVEGVYRRLIKTDSVDDEKDPLQAIWSRLQ